MTPTPSQGPPIPQGGGGMMGYDHDHDHGRGGGGGTRNLEHIYINNRSIEMVEMCKAQMNVKLVNSV